MESVPKSEISSKQILIELYKNGVYEEINQSSIPVSIKNELEKRVFRHLTLSENYPDIVKREPIIWFKVSLLNGDTIYGGRYCEEHIDDYDSDTGKSNYNNNGLPLAEKVRYAPAFCFFETDRNGYELGHASVRFEPDDTIMPRVDYVHSNQHHTGRGTARYFLMNQLCENFFGIKLYSGRSHPDNAPTKIWKRFEEQGLVRRVYTKKGPDGKFIISTDPSQKNVPNTFVRYQFL